MNFNLTGNTSAPANNAGALNLTKGSVLDLTKAAPALHNCILGGGWDMAVAGPAADLDLAAFMLNAQGRVERVPQDVIFFNNMHANGISLAGDNRTGAGEGDDERININLDQIESRINKIVFFIVIHDAMAKRQTFGMINNSFVRLLDADDREREICRYDLKERYATDTAITVCSLNRNARGWEFEAIGDGSVADLNDLLGRYM
jgi:tellurium resistance protein TerD